MPRVAWPDYFMSIAHLVAERSTCLRRRVGAVAVKDKRILATGYNGAPSQVAHCLDVGCLRDQLGVPSGQRHEICRGLHAEQNVIIQAAIHGISLTGAELYSTHQPCLICSKMLINCGITTIWYASGYPDELAVPMLKEAGVKLEHLPFCPENGVRDVDSVQGCASGCPSATGYTPETGCACTPKGTATEGTHE